MTQCNHEILEHGKRMYKNHCQSDVIPGKPKAMAVVEDLGLKS
jgi:hypothetical protein